MIGEDNQRSCVEISVESIYALYRRQEQMSYILCWSTSTDIMRVFGGKFNWFPVQHQCCSIAYLAIMSTSSISCAVSVIIL